jgi:molecular chaperone DnaK (HSP70)
LLESATGSWKDKKVEFVFSLPTTWNSLDTTKKFNEAIRAAGFTAENPEKHSAKLESTEADAAAVYMATNPQVALVKDDIILICDAGGGTTE